MLCVASCQAQRAHGPERSPPGPRGRELGGEGRFWWHLRRAGGFGIALPAWGEGWGRPGVRGWLHTKEPAARSRHEAGNQSPRRPSDKKGSRGGRGSSQETLPAPTAPASAAQRKGTAKRHGQRTDGQPDRRPDPAGAKPSHLAPPPRSPGVWWVPRCAGKNGAAGWETKLGWAPRNLGSVRGRPAWGWRLGWGGGERGKWGGRGEM